MVYWDSVRWFVYRSPAGLRVLDWQLIPGEMRPGEALAAVVSRCSWRTVVELLREGVPPEQIQDRVDLFAAAQLQRTRAARGLAA